MQKYRNCCITYDKWKIKCKRIGILMPKSKAPSKKEKTLSLPNHNGFNNNLPYPLQLTHPPFILLRGITNLPTNHPIPFTNYSYILTILLITIITPFSYISNNQVPINTHPFKTTLSSRLKFVSIKILPLSNTKLSSNSWKLSKPLQLQQ